MPPLACLPLPILGWIHGYVLRLCVCVYVCAMGVGKGQEQLCRPGVYLINEILLGRKKGVVRALAPQLSPCTTSKGPKEKRVFRRREFSIGTRLEEP